MATKAEELRRMAQEIKNETQVGANTAERVGTAFEQAANGLAELSQNVGGVAEELALGAVYDVSAKNPTGGSNNDGKWESLSALLSDTNLSTLIPTPVRKGGMSIKFVQSSDNKYVQYRLMATTWSTNVANWQGVDDEPTAGSQNLVKSGGVSNKINNTYKKYVIDSPDSDFDIVDSNGFVIARFSGGHIKTKNFDSRNSQYNTLESFNLIHIILLGQSLSMGYNSGPCLNKVNTSKALMFKQVRTQDFGYIFNIDKSTYNANQEYYDNQFYSDVKGLLETGGNGSQASQWESASYNEYETPCSGIVEGLLNCYKNEGLSDIPFYTLCTASGIGGTPITSFDDDSDKIINRTQRDIISGYRLALSRGLTYKPVFIWVQGENNAGFTKESIKTSLNTVYTNLVQFLTDKGLIKGEYKVPFISYQSEYNPSGYYTGGNQNNALAQFEMNQEKDWFYLAYPIYNLELASDKVHLTNVSSRLMGNSIGVSLYHIINGNFNTLKIVDAQLDGNTALLKFNRKITTDYEHLSRTGYTAEQNQTIQNNYGFFVFDSNGNEISISNISVVNGDSVKIVCASQPSEIRYGYRQQTDNYTIGGIIREDKVYNSYGEINMYLYAPIQYIKEFSSKFNF
jgi:hypothetical protein